MNILIYCRTRERCSHQAERRQIVIVVIVALVNSRELQLLWLLLRHGSDCGLDCREWRHLVFRGNILDLKKEILSNLYSTIVVTGLKKTAPTYWQTNCLLNYCRTNTRLVSLSVSRCSAPKEEVSRRLLNRDARWHVVVVPVEWN